MAIDLPMNTLQKVVYKGTELNKFDVAGCKWRKPYVVAFPILPTGVASITVTRTATESNCQTYTTSLTHAGTALYGDTVSVSATASSGYTSPTVSFTSGVSNGKVTGNVTISVTAGQVSSQTVWTGTSSKTIRFAGANTSIISGVTWDGSSPIRINGTLKCGSNTAANYAEIEAGDLIYSKSGDMGDFPTIRIGGFSISGTTLTVSYTAQNGASTNIGIGAVLTFVIQSVEVSQS